MSFTVMPDLRPDDYEETPFPKRPRCPHCMAYISQTPTFDGIREYHHPLGYHDENGEWIDKGFRVEQHYETEWECKRCKRLSEPDEWRGS